MNSVISITIVGAVTLASAFAAIGVSWLLLKLVLGTMVKAAARSRR